MKTSQQVPAKSLIYVWLGAGAISTLLPFVWMVLSSLKTRNEMTSVPPAVLPSTPQWGNYPSALSMAPFLRYFFNTLLVAGGTTLAVVLTSILAGFAFAKLDFKFKNYVFVGMISLMMIPGEMLVITNFQTVVNFGWIDSYLAMIVPFAVNIFYIYLMRNYFIGIPGTLYNAAKVDGCSDWQFLWKILVQNAKPGIVTVGILTFINSWNAFLWPFLVTNDPKMRLLNNGLVAFVTEAGSDPQLQMAASTMIVIPIVIVYFFARKQIINGIGGGTGGTKS
ncbi:carbohydrate ABC transporter permease [Paenibacillus cremeus]|uniref:Carbohydrate ABC transporter permease n=1 Tax=Paenibacillus cremeus TaxID=2163881 RepID=A0A559KEC4_9BACL|nr:carbohydrate ABC transporter permease [Paenibacillus cremeus]TVY10480.1 carbohydrate ABC transporter permease [Paenibacillus cremeus]